MAVRAHFSNTCRRGSLVARLLLLAACPGLRAESRFRAHAHQSSGASQAARGWNAPWAHAAGPGSSHAALQPRAPLLLVSDGCSGSTWIMNVLTQLLTQAGVRLCDWPGRSRCIEVLDRKACNPHWASTDDRQQGFRNLHAHCTATNSTLFAKGKPVSKVVDAAPTLAALDARVAFTFRSNKIDRTLCAVADCFDTLSGVNVYVANGTQATKCFARRKDPWTSAATLAVKLTDVPRFVRHLTRVRSAAGDTVGGPDSGYMLEAAGLGPAPIIPTSYEELALSGHSPELMPLSVAAFRRLMFALGHPVPEALVWSVLSLGAGKRPKPRSHRAMVYNYPVLRRALDEDASVPRELRAMLRRGPA